MASISDQSKQPALTQEKPTSEISVKPTCSGKTSEGKKLYLGKHARAKELGDMKTAPEESTSPALFQADGQEKKADKAKQSSSQASTGRKKSSGGGKGLNKESAQKVEEYGQPFQGKDTLRSPYPYPINTKKGEIKISSSTFELVEKKFTGAFEGIQDKYGVDIKKKITEMPQANHSEILNISFETKNIAQPADIHDATKDFNELCNKIDSDLEPPKQYLIHDKVTVKIHECDITEMEVDAIVNAANGHLKHSGGVARAIKLHAGKELKLASKKAVADHGKEFPDSDVIATTGGSLPCQLVLHAVGPRWPKLKTHKSITDMSRKNKEQICVRLLYETFLNTLNYAVDQGMTSIAIPPVSSGIFGVPHHHVAYQMAHAIMNFAQNISEPKLRVIHVVDLTNSILLEVSKNLSLSECVSVQDYEPETGAAKLGEAETTSSKKKQSPNSVGPRPTAQQTYQSYLSKKPQKQPTRTDQPCHHVEV